MPFDVERRVIETLTTGTWDETDPSWSPDGKRLLFEAVGRVWLWESSAPEPRRLTPADFTPTSYGDVRWPQGLLPKTAEHLSKLNIVRCGLSWAAVHQLGQTWAQISRNPGGATGAIGGAVGGSLGGTVSGVGDAVGDTVSGVGGAVGDTVSGVGGAVGGALGGDGMAADEVPMPDDHAAEVLRPRPVGQQVDEGPADLSRPHLLHHGRPGEKSVDLALGQQGQKENACVALRQLEKRYPDASANVKDRATRAKKSYSC